MRLQTHCVQLRILLLLCLFALAPAFVAHGTLFKATGSSQNPISRCPNEIDAHSTEWTSRRLFLQRPSMEIVQRTKFHLSACVKASAFRPSIVRRQWMLQAKAKAVPTTFGDVHNNITQTNQVVGAWRDPSIAGSRPASQIFPNYLLSMHPATQIALTTAAYVFHMFVLSKHVIPLPIQIIPNTSGLFHSIAVETLAGIIMLFAVAYVRKLQRLPLLPSISHLPTPRPTDTTARQVVVLALLTLLYLISGRSVSLWDRVFYACYKAGRRIPWPMQRSLQILLSHFAWVAPGMLVLRLCRGFFASNSAYIRARLNESWVWWAIAGYYISCALLNVCNVLNEYLIPQASFEEANAVTELINPSGNTISSLAVGAIAPCLSAPVWEEIFYRGFFLSVLAQRLPLTFALPLSALLFAGHHASLAGMLPLSALGFAWSLIYVLSGNLVTAIAIHAMWNSRIFLGSFFGV